MDKSELQALIKETVESTVSEKVDEAVAPLKEQATQNFPYVNTGHESEKNIPPKSNGIGAARFVRALASSQGEPEKAKRFAEKTWNDDLGKHITKALAGGDFSAGGFVVPPDFSNEIIELLRSENIVRQANPGNVPLPNGQLTIPRQSGSASASWVGENQSVNASQPSGGQITLSAKKLMGLVPISNELLDYAQGNTADRMVRDDLVDVLSTEEDKAFLRSDGLNGEPRGIRNWAANVTSSNGNTLANIRADLQELFLDLKNNNVRMRRPALFMSERERAALQFEVVDSNGNLVFSEEITNNGTLMGWPIFTSTNIPTDLNSSTDSEIYLVDMAEALVGDVEEGIRIDASTEATYQDSSGTSQSAFALDQTAVRSMLRVDFAMRHNEAAAVKTGVDYTQ